MKLTFPFRVHGLLRRTDVERRGAMRYRKYVSETKWHLNENAYSPVRARAGAPACLPPPLSPRRRVLPNFVYVFVHGRAAAFGDSTSRNIACERTNERASERTQQHFRGNYYLG
jgi:hypothetical protein